MLGNFNSSPAFLIRYGRTEQHVQSSISRYIYIHMLAS